MTTLLFWSGAVVLFLAADFALGVKVGRLLKRDEPDDGDDFTPFPGRRLWQPAGDDLNDPREDLRDTPPA